MIQAVSLAAESKREEEKAKGVVNSENETENPDIVPFEDNEEEEEEESEEDDESFTPTAQGRGRGRGMMWPSHMSMMRGPRPLPGIRGFPPAMLGPDGFPYGAVAPDNFPMPDPFGVGSRAFAPYGPRFSNDLMFHGRPSQPGGVFPGGGFGMMMGPGPGRGPFLGGMGAPPRPNWPVGMPPMFQQPPSQPTSNRTIKRDQRAPANAGLDQGKGQEPGGPTGVPDDGSKGQYEDHQYGVGNSSRNDDSESEDEAPRRSRHGEGKKKRRSLEREGTAGSGL